MSLTQELPPPQKRNHCNKDIQCQGHKDYPLPIKLDLYMSISQGLSPPH